MIVSGSHAAFEADGIVLDGPIPPLLIVAAAVILTGLSQLYFRRRARGPGRGIDVAILIAVVALTGVIELAMGRTPTYKYGPVRLWSGQVHSNQNSQQIADPYTPTHIIHGAVLYGVTRAALSTQPLALRAIVATTAEAAWEALENTDRVIQRYRAATISLDYYGDSVINSVCDIAACILGFALAWRLPVRVTIIWIVLIEATLALCIHDNLTLNILMLLYPIESIRAWQMRG